MALLFVLGVCSGPGCSEGPCSNHDPDAYLWECWIEIDTLEAPYRTEDVVVELQRERVGSHLVLLLDPPDLSDAAEVNRAIVAAEAILVDGYSVRDNPVIDVNRAIDWGANPRGDSNWHFQLNALRPVRPLFIAYSITGDRRYYDVALEVVHDWIDYNIVRDQANSMKWYDMSTGLRAVFLANALDYELRRDDLDTRRLYQLVRAAKLHMDVLQDTDGSALNNHDLFVLLGLRALIHRAPELLAADPALSHSSTMLDMLVDDQFTSEHIHKEHSPSYHLFVGEVFATLASTGLFDDEPKLHEYAEGARNHYHELFHPNGDVVMVGDSATDSCPSVSEACRYLNSDGREGELPDDQDGYYPEAGVAIFRTSWQVAPPDEHSFLYFSGAFHDQTHAHSDFFTFEWSELGMPIVVDSGKYTYEAGVWRDFFTGTRAGNTIEIDGRNCSVYREVPYGSALTSWGEVEDGLRFAEAAATRTQANVHHARLLLFREGQWLVVIDRLNADWEHTYRQWFGFHEDISVTQTTDGFHAVLPDERGDVFVRELDTSSPETLEIARGEQGDRIQGWISRTYLEKQPRYSIAFGRSGEDEILVTVLSLGSPVTNTSVTQQTDTVRFAFTTGDGGIEDFEYAFGDGGGSVRRIAR